MRPDMKPVMLVGAGPGSADLLTLRAARVIGEAEALLYDALVSEEVLALAPAHCFKIQTGKRRGRASMSQDVINRLMARLAKRGLKVVRLKGGDPSVFGRVSEEADHLRAEGVDCEIVPGVTAACAAAAQFQFPLTHRREARRVVFSTAVLDAGVVQTDWSVAADTEATLAIYMGAMEASTISEKMIAAGRSASTPALAVERAGSPDARMVAGVLGRLPELVAPLGPGPILIVVGEVAARAPAVQAVSAAA